MQAKRETLAQPLVESVLTASRVLVGIAARSLSDAQDEVTLPQYRTLVVLQAKGPQSLLAVGRGASGRSIDCDADVRSTGSKAADPPGVGGDEST